MLALAVPVVAEEEVARGGITAVGERFWLIDPLDGTKGFVTTCRRWPVKPRPST